MQQLLTKKCPLGRLRALRRGFMNIPKVRKNYELSPKKCAEAHTLGGSGSVTALGFI